MTDVFISYSRKDKVFVQQLVGILGAPKPKGAGMDIWVDWEDIPPTSQWWQEIKEGIEAADNFVFIISPDSVASEVCGWELAHAIKHNKRIIAVVHRDVPNPPVELGAINFIFLRDLAKDRDELRKLVTALRTDLQWVKMHTRLEVRAVEWEKNNRDTSFCLYGKDLNQAERWLKAAKGKNPAITALQSEYIEASQRNRTRRRRLTVGLSGAAGIIVIILIGLFLFQTQRTNIEAEQKQNAQLTAEFEGVQRATQQSIADVQSRFALARRLAQDSVQLQSQQYDRAILLAAASYQIEPSQESAANLSNILQASPYLRTFLWGHSAAITALGFSRDSSHQLVSGDANGTIRFWDLTERKESAPPLTQHTAPIVGLFLLPYELVSADQTGHIFVWDLDTRQPRLSLTTPNGTLLAISAFVPYEAESVNIVYAYCTTTDSPCSSLSVDTADYMTGQVINTISIPGSVGAVAISPDGTSIAVGAPLYQFDQPPIAIYNTYDGSQIQTLTGHANYPAIYALAYDSSGRYLASGSCFRGVWGAASNPDSCEVGEAILWNLDTGEPLAAPTGLANYITHIATNPPLDYQYSSSPWGTLGQSISMSTGDNPIFQFGYDTVDNATIRDSLSLTGHASPVTAFAYSSQSPFDISFEQESYLVSGAQDGTLAVWDLLTNPPLGHEFMTVSESYFQLNFSPDGSRLAFHYTDDQYRIVDTQTHQVLNQLYGAINLALGPDDYVAVLDQDHNVTLHRIFDQIELPVVQSQSFSQSQMIFSPDGRFLAVDESVGAVNLFTLEDDNLRWSHSVFYDGTLEQIAFTNDSSHLTTIACVPDSANCTYQQMIVSNLAVPDDEQRVNAPMIFGLTTDNQFAIVRDFAGIAVMRMDATQEVIQRFGLLTTAVCSPDGNYLAGYDEEGYIHVYDLHTGELLWKTSDYKFPSYGPTPVIFDPSGSWVASGDFLGDIHIWDSRSGKSFFSVKERYVDPNLSVLDDFMRTMVFSPQGKMLAANGHGKFNGVILWDFDLIKQACTTANRDLTSAEHQEYGIADDMTICSQFVPKDT